MKITQTLACICALSASYTPSWAQAGALEKAMPSGYDESRDQGMSAAKEMRELLAKSPLKINPVVSDKRLSEMLADKAVEAYGEDFLGWNNKTGRWIEIITFEVPRRMLQGTDIEKEYEMRQMAYIAALLKAQASWSEFLGASMPIEAALLQPGMPPVSENQQKIAQIEKQKAELQKLVADMKLQLSDSERNDFLSKAADRVGSATNALLSKIDKQTEESREVAVQEKQAKAAELKRLIAQHQQSISELQDIVTNYVSAFAQNTISVNASIKYDHIVWGLSTILAGEIVTEKSMEVGLVVAWSPKLAQSVYSTLLGDPSLAPSESPKGEKSFGAWLRAQDVMTLAPFGNYVDDDGIRWFFGCGMAPKVEIGDKAERFAAYMAKINLFLPLQAHLAGEQRIEVKSSYGKVGIETASRLFSQLNAQTLANTRGLSSKLKVRRRVEVATGDGSKGTRPVDVEVSVWAVETRASAEALKAMAQSAIYAAEKAREYNRRELERKQANQHVKDAEKQTAPSRMPGLLQPAATKQAKAAPVQAAPSAAKSSEPKTTALQDEADAKNTSRIPGASVSPVGKPNF